jgi:hypothetical protein
MALAFGGTDAVQGLGQCAGIRGVDVDGLGLHDLHHEQRRDQCGDQVFQ